jgi:CDP-diacylglycerol---glycerol-3-phosphate 3-phosphatidyltransferase
VSSTAATHVPADPTSLQRRIPNVLTAARLVIAAAFFVLLAAWNYPARHLIDEAKIGPLRPLWPYLAAAALFGLAALTDAIDGPLARKWKVVSKFGRVMDPFADKVLVVGAFIMLAGPTFGVEAEGRPPFQVSGVTSWMVVVILGRELLVTSFRAVLEGDGHDFSATWSGKAKMVLQACVIPFILVILGVFDVRRGAVGRWLIDISVWVTVGVTILSGVPYVRRGLTMLR